MRITKAMQSHLPCPVLRDQREKEANRWEFKQSKYCAGTEDAHLITGDYTLKGFADKFTIERKASVKDFVQSIARPQFEEELVRMSDLSHAFVIIECHMEDVAEWPRSSGQNPWVQSKLALHHPGAAFARYLHLKLSYPYVDFIFAGTCGKMLAGSIFKRILEAYAK